MLIQIHLLQNYAPSNLNRDDTGSPKDAIFGGTRRGRISSQCLKRSIRRSEAFSQAFRDDGLLGTRTLKLPELVRQELVALGAEPQAVAAIVARVPEIGRESAKKKSQEEDAEGEEEVEETVTKQLVFIGKSELRPLAEKLLAIYREDGTKWPKAKIDEITKRLGASVPCSVDIALFGRMTTSAAFEDVQAACQVAHALTTHTITQEFDYYTAVDDLSTEPGAPMIGDIEFNSATYYKYINLHWEQLVHNLGGDAAVARRAVLALLQAAATAQPSGKQNTFAAQSLPDYILVEVRPTNLPVSYANAFIKPVRSAGNLLEVSAEQLNGYIGRVTAAYSLPGVRAQLSLLDSEPLPGAEVLPSLEALGGWLAAHLPEH
ncbi:MAG: type I-E CRISPR-associated protein Cas7/Cse4/CasC [Chloroflexi bacterium]|nr:type I-E CRISPR-associated protein Cas7/Cse4/CasC [Chloroflexota bacterium]